MRLFVGIFFFFILTDSYSQSLHIEYDTIIATTPISSTGKIFDDDYKLIGYIDANIKDFPHFHVVNIIDGKSFRARFYAKMVFNVRKGRIAFFETENLPSGLTIRANHRLRLKKYNGDFIPVKYPIVTRNIDYDLVTTSKGRFIAAYSDSITSEGVIICVKRNGNIAWRAEVPEYSHVEKSYIIPYLYLFDDDEIVLLTTYRFGEPPDRQRRQSFYIFNSKDGTLLKQNHFDVTYESPLIVNVFNDTDDKIQLINDTMLVSIDIPTMKEETYYHSIPTISSESNTEHVIAYFSNHNTFIILDRDCHIISSFNQVNGLISQISLEPAYFYNRGMDISWDEIIFKEFVNPHIYLSRITFNSNTD